MAGQGMERREVLRVMALAAAASQFPGFYRWSFACSHLSAAPVQVTPGRYTPQFFSSQEYSTLERLTEMIIPSDGSPGAHEAGVSEFIDFMVWSDPGEQYRFKLGLAWLDAHSTTLFGKLFLKLSADQQKDILNHIAFKNQHRPGEEDGREFFQLVRRYTMMGFYTTRAGLEQLDCPALKFYAESPGCPHTDDPDHLHLPPPKV